MGALDIAKRLDIKHNVSIRVLDEVSGKVISEHTGHNASTNSILTGIAHYLTGEGVLNQSDILSSWVPQYISLGTMGLLNQDSDENGLPSGIGAIDYSGKRYKELSDDCLKILGIDDVTVYGDEFINEDDNVILRYTDYMKQSPGFGADGYDRNLNNDRIYLGLGPMFADRTANPTIEDKVQRGDINQDGTIDQKDLIMLLEHLSNTSSVPFTAKQRIAADVNGDDKIDELDVYCLKSYLEGTGDKPGEGVYKHNAPTVNCELITESYPRSTISFRDIVPESQSEYPKTIDIVFSAFVSTGALAQFRGDKDYIFITEAGLWSNRNWPTQLNDEGEYEPSYDTGDNGLLAGYRIAPPDEYNWDMSKKENRDILNRNIIRVGINQVVQVVWKIQLGGIDQLGGIEKLYPSENRLRWKVWS